MMKKFFGNIIFALVAVLAVTLIFAALSSCTKEQEADTVAPLIVMVEPQEGDTLFINEYSHIEINISDERELDSCRFEVYANLDNYKHKSALLDFTNNSDVPWSYSRTYHLEGIKSTTLHDHTFIVPDSVGLDPIAHGAYQFEVNCWDKAGNQTSILLNVIIAARPDASLWIRLITGC